MEAKGVTPVRNLLQKIGIKSSLFDIAEDKSFDWMAAAAKLKGVLNKDFLFSISVLPDPTNQSINHISIMKPYVATSLRPASVNLLDYVKIAADRMDPAQSNSADSSALRKQKNAQLIQSLAEREILNLDVSTAYRVFILL